MNTSRVATVALIVFSFAGSACAESSKLWELDGLKAPESVVFDSKANALYVSNIDGDVLAKDGNGFLSKVSPDGKMIEAQWVTGFNAPKGLALTGNTLYVADIDELVEVDVAKGAIVKKQAAEGAAFLNDVAASPDGRVFVSDTGKNTIWSLENGTLSPWLKDDKLKSPNGLLVAGDVIVVAGFGTTPQGEKPGVPANLIEVSLSTKRIRDLAADGASPAGHLDGVEPFGDGGLLVTDWVNGALIKTDQAGSSQELLDFSKGSADLAYVQATKTAYIPLMLEGKLVAYKLD